MIELTEGLNEVTVSLAPSGVLPLPEGFYVETITAEPSVVVLGNEVKIHVEYNLPDGVDVRPYIGKTYRAHCTIDGETLTILVGPIPYFPVDAYFVCIPQSIGTYTATVLNASVAFEVRQEVVGVYYSPYGGYDSFGSIDELANYINNNELGETTDCFQGNCWWIQHCPYCDYSLKAGYYYARNPSDTLKSVYGVLDHIQSSHPDHPLTKPRCHIEIIVPEPPITEININTRDAVTYFANFNRETVWPGVPSWHTLGWEVVQWPLASAVYKRVNDFVSDYGTRHIIIKGPIACRAYVGVYRGTVQTPTEGMFPVSDAPTVLDADVTLQAVGDKVTIDVETGLVGYEEWKVPTF
jgi:hypothetical protein